MFSELPREIQQKIMPNRIEFIRYFNQKYENGESLERAFELAVEKYNV